MNRNVHRSSLAIGAVMAMAGCGGSSGGDPASDGTGSISFSVTDAPVDDAAAVVIAMTEFELKPSGDRSPFKVPVVGAPRQLNLLEFTDGASAEIIVDEEVPAGEYEWLRIYFDQELSFIQLESDGTMFPLFIPSGAQTGYKLESGFTVPLNDDVEYLLDFNVRESVIEPPGLAGPNGEPRTFLLKPTVRIMNVEETGGVQGIVSSDLVDLSNARCALADPPLSGNAVYVFEGVDAQLDDVAEEEADERSGPLTSDVVDLNVGTGLYEYHLMALLPGLYTLAFTCSGMADGAGDDDYPAPSDSGFDFDATTSVEVVSGVVETCDIGSLGPSGPC